MTHSNENQRGISRFFGSRGRASRRAKTARRRNPLGLELRSALFQPLEERVMLDIGGANSLPPTIVVGRTLSAYDVPDVTNNQETLTFTVYNQAADPITGVLLTDTLASGVTFASASQLPDQNGQQLAWSLGTIKPYDRASVTLTVTLGAGFGAGLLPPPPPTTPPLDTGASAYGTLDAGMVTWTTAPATLRTTAIAANLLASTPDANTTDPYVQEEAAQLNYDPTQIYNFLHTQIGYNSYAGSLRGARGTLWSNAGNSLDDASLGVALMRASGIPAQYEQGTLSQAQAQQLILSMFPASYQTVGYIPAGTQTSDPANDAQLLSETEQHYWFQFDAGSGMKDADPEFSGQAIGQTAATSIGNFTEVPDSLRQKTEVSLTAEIYNQGAAALTGGSGLSQTVVLDQTFNDVDLVGRPLTIGNFVTQSGIGATFTSVTNTYTPYIVIGDDALPDSQLPDAITGKSYQEVLTNFAFGSQVLTGLFLNLTLTGAGATSQTFERSLVDRIGYAARQGNAPTPAISVSPSDPPVVTAFDLTTLNILGGMQSAGGAALAQEQAVQVTSNATLAAAPTALAQTDALIIAARSELANFAVVSDTETANLASGYSLAAYFDAPRITLFSSTVTTGNGQSNLAFGIDLVHDSINAIASGQNTQAPFGFAAVRGIFDSILESDAVPVPPGGVNLSSMSIIMRLQAAGVPIVTIGEQNLSALQTLNLPSDAIARMTSDVQNGLVVIVPATGLKIDGTATTAWLVANRVTGEVLSQDQNGGYAGDFVGFLATNAFAGILYGVAVSNIGGLMASGISQKPYTVQSFAKNSLIGAVGGLIFGIPGGFLFGLASWVTNIPLDGVLKGPLAPLANIDPPVAPLLVGLNIPYPTIRKGTAGTDMRETSNQVTGHVTGTLQQSNTVVSGSLTATWQDPAVGSFVATSLGADVATIADAKGTTVGSGMVGLSRQTAVPLSVSGDAQYHVNGIGSLSIYAAAETNLGVSGNWQNYSATVTGNVSLTLTAASKLTLNGQALPAGTYTITTDRAALVGNGTTTAPNFAGSASITVSGGTIELGPGSRNLSVGGMPMNTSDEAAVAGYNGSINVSANGNGTDAVTLSGDAANVLTLAPSPTTLTTDQNTPVSFNSGVQTSFADTYNFTANAPAGWTVTIDDTGNVTVTPAPGTQSGTFPIQVIAQSTTDPDLISQATVEVTVTPTTPGMTFAINPDPVFTVPFDNAQVPSAFRATIQNTGHAADTYNLTFSTIPAGFALVDSGTSVTVPAGQTGILGLYLQPTGATLPPVGTQVSFTVTATSTKDPSITQTVNVSFTMPAIAAATMTSDPVELSTTPGMATTATITITNVGNVPYNAVLATTTDSGLAISGLSSPRMIAVGQSVTETATLTPDASTPLNSTLNATVNVDQAAAVTGVSVVAVRATSVSGATSPHPNPLVCGP